MNTFVSRISLFLLLGLSLLAGPVSVQQGDMDDEAPDIVETAVQADDFDTLVQALEAADFAGDLKGEGPFTVLAPMDGAFDQLEVGGFESRLKVG